MHFKTLAATALATVALASCTTQADVMQSNGVIHVVDGVLLPSM